MTRAALCSAVAGIAKVMAHSPADHADLVDAFVLLAESLVELGVPPASQKQQGIERLVQVECSLPELTRAQRMAAVMQDLGIGRSRYYELRAAAMEQQLLTQSGESGKKTDCRTAPRVRLNRDHDAA